ncbi:gliding motility-associated ABC transporter ATP-binding subunit GldA [Paludibacter jiangxiensis]|uniref:ABC-2 type transport system ATP-binding protein n=1 Tax=Paludibacter jiangxiensis TaxID=681398 RepID=A0A170YP76_9BACT|nr:gliding motility-associated ABC transporter ATP-binding subunit GldA [Paludibacter jiangxiensis]GAT61952.1 ABC-2 type transport system ATP-binding protein [Paludibacter jiangxiensis]
MSLSIQQLTKYYGQQAALNNVSFELHAGEIAGFLGPNGAGKSTLMKIVTGYISADAGTVSVCGEKVTETGLETRRMIGYLPEHNPLYPDLYVKEYLQFVAGMYHLGKQSKSRVDEMIERTGLTGEYKKRIGQLSKGYRQRVGLAQALIHDPKVLILDEPTTGLDPNQLTEIRNLIIEVGKEKTVLFSTHIMQEVKAICKRVIIINNGKLVADSTEDSLLHEVDKDRFGALVEFAGVIVPDRLCSIPGVLRVDPIGKNTFQVTSTTDVRSDIFRLAVETNIPLLTLQQQAQSMEDVFKKLTN